VPEGGSCQLVVSSPTSDVGSMSVSRGISPAPEAQPRNPANRDATPLDSPLAPSIGTAVPVSQAAGPEVPVLAAEAQVLAQVPQKVSAGAGMTAPADARQETTSSHASQVVPHSLPVQRPVAPPSLPSHYDSTILSALPPSPGVYPRRVRSPVRPAPTRTPVQYDEVSRSRKTKDSEVYRVQREPVTKDSAAQHHRNIPTPPPTRDDADEPTPRDVYAVVPGGPGGRPASVPPLEPEDPTVWGPGVFGPPSPDYLATAVVPGADVFRPPTQPTQFVGPIYTLPMKTRPDPRTQQPPPVLLSRGTVSPNSIFVARPAPRRPEVLFSPLGA